MGPAGSSMEHAMADFTDLPVSGGVGNWHFNRFRIAFEGSIDAQSFRKQFIDLVGHLRLCRCSPLCPTEARDELSRQRVNRRSGAAACGFVGGGRAVSTGRPSEARRPQLHRLDNNKVAYR